MDREEAIEIINRNCTEGSQLREACAMFIPELRESEDERIRKGLVELIDNWNYPQELFTTKRNIIAYLEKQKDAFENGRQLGIMQEQARQELGWPDEKKKEHQNNSDAPEKALGRDLISPKDKDKNLDEIAQDYVDGVKEYNPEPTWDLMQTAVCYGYHYCEQKEQKPDDDPLDDPKFLKGFDTGREVQRIFDEQKPAEWSEEDEMMLSSIIETLKYTNGAANMKIDWLKSLHPQPKQEWSEDDEHRRKDAIYFLESAMRHYADTSEIEKTIAWLKSLRPSWKPSEWQMSMLLAVINDPNNAGSESCYLTLKSIYEQLKKL